MGSLGCVIEVEEIAEALVQWQQFEGVLQAFREGETDEPVTRAHQRYEITDKELLSKLMRLRADDGRADESASNLRALARGVGLSDDAYRAFLEGFDSVSRHYHELPVENAIDLAAVAGLIVGLTARKLADDAGPSD